MLHVVSSEISLSLSDLRLHLSIHAFRCRLTPAVVLTQAECFFVYLAVTSWSIKGKRDQRKYGPFNGCLIFAIYLRFVTLLILSKLSKSVVVLIFFEPSCHSKLASEKSRTHFAISVLITQFNN